MKKFRDIKQHISESSGHIIIEDSELNEAVEVSSDYYQYANGKKPAGHGNWMFTPHRSGIQPSHKEGENYISVTGKYGEAKKKAQVWAKSLGHTKIHVAESVDNMKHQLDETTQDKVTIHSPGHQLHGVTADVFHRHDDGRINVQVRKSSKKGDVLNLTLKKDQYKSADDIPFSGQYMKKDTDSVIKKRMGYKSLKPSKPTAKEVEVHVPGVGRMTKEQAKKHYNFSEGKSFLEEPSKLDEMSGAGMNVRAIHKHLTKGGWSLTRTSGGHDVYTHPNASNHIAVPRHKGDLKAPLVLGILKQSKIKESVDLYEFWRAPEGRKTHDGEFQNKEHGTWYTYKKTSHPWAMKHGLPHEIDVADGVRFGHVKGTVAHIATDENADGTPKMEKWGLKNHSKWLKEDVDLTESRKSDIVKDAWKKARSRKEETTEPQSDSDKKLDYRKDTFQKDPELNDAISKE